MAQRPKPPRLRIVKVRLSGHPDDVAAVADRIAQEFTASTPSPAYPNRHDPGIVRVYLEVDPR
ncbi:uncharacterized protein (DUF1800 family) [Streptomonospora nanhaiensis]|uniref:Uncharacterized protein (DUF1800 family) n=1 Tax=Streptomonospora nanhaiensis TaxID=1323731 RepID=A0A853BLN6_9ACTN|nr:hypothetical protein [Streptomonospora nanhaiensis]NYI95900.1 uncharacterized protein (DUF1800 family) [Streptomonospora nanhaiensis]